MSKDFGSISSRKEIKRMKSFLRRWSAVTTVFIGVFGLISGIVIIGLYLSTVLPNLILGVLFFLVWTALIASSIN